MPLWIKRAPKKIGFKCITRCFHVSSSHIESHVLSPTTHPKAETLWFIKVVCTFCCIHGSKNLNFLIADYFCKNLSHSVTFYVIQYISNNFGNPRLALQFFQFARVNLSPGHSTATFDSLLRSLCQMGLLDSAELLFDYMISYGILVDRQVLEVLVSSFANAGKFRIAKEILISQAKLSIEKGEIVSSFVYNNFLSLLVKQSRVDEAVRFFQDHILKLMSFCPDTCSFNILIQGLCRAGQVDKAFELFNDMGSFGCLPDLRSYNSLVNGLSRHGDVDRARDILRDIQAQGILSPDVVTYTSIISGFCKMGRMEEAACLLDNMIHYGIRPNLFTFNVLIDGFCKSGEMVSAFKMFEMMATFGCAPDVISFTSLISGHCQIGELDQGLKLWDEMNAKKLYPNAYTFSIIINALCKENRLNEARDLLRQLQWRNDIVPQAFIYNPVIDGFCKSGNVDEANAIVAEMEAKKCTPDKYTYTILILGHCMKGRMHEAINVFKKMSTVGCAPDQITINSLVSCLLKAGLVNEAYGIKKASSEGLQSGLLASKRPGPLREKVDIPVAA